MKGLVAFLIAAGALGAGIYGVTRGGTQPLLSGSRRRRRGYGLRGDAEVGELKTFIDNDGDLYRQQTTYIMKNLATKLAKGVYDRAFAEKAWMHLVENGAKKYAKKYAKEEAGGGTWHQMFSMEDRRAVAKDLNDEFLVEYKLGNYDKLLPKKYQRA